MLNNVYQDFSDPDGTFLGEFQSAGFNARFFELYLFAYFSRSGFLVDRSHESPDFLATKDGLTVAVEATTVNPSTSGALAGSEVTFTDMAPEERLKYLQEELPIRFGSPLFSKLKKRYWELDHCKGFPIVIAIEAFHQKDAHVFADTSLASYLYGIWHYGDLQKSGNLRINAQPVGKHKLKEKSIPSNFFAQSDTENISAVLFTNCGTHAKFSRMGYLHGYGCDLIDMVRTGYFFNSDPDAMDPTFFSYNLDEPPLVETWGEGLVAFHNPHCLHPIPHTFFVSAVQGYVKDGMFMTDHTYAPWHPISSTTMVRHVGEAKAKLSEVLPRRGRCAISSIPKKAFQQMWGFAISEDNPLIEERGWFADESGSFLEVVFEDKIDHDWSCVILARDQLFQFRVIFCESSLSTRWSAVDILHEKMVKLLSSPKRIYTDGGNAPVSGPFSDKVRMG
jgi:hypothetical protein